MKKLIVYENLDTFKKIANGECYAIFRAYSKANYVKYSNHRIVRIRVKGREEFLEFLIKDVTVLTDKLDKKFINILLK